MSIRRLVPLILIGFGNVANTQRTALDQFAPQFRIVKENLLRTLGRTAENPDNLRIAKNLNKLQPNLPDSTPFPCPLNNARSTTPPTSVHALRPGDIDITASLGDSLAAGNGLAATNLLQVILENRGISYSAGGQADWKSCLTLPNIFKEFNPNLIGYTRRDSFAFQNESQFSVAEPGAMSRDMPYMSKVLVKRLKTDKRVRVAEHWKIIHLFIGANDFCADACYYKNPEVVVENHRRDLLAVLRTFKKNLPRTFVNVILSPNLQILANVTLSNRPSICYFTHNFLCPCLFGLQFAGLQKRLFNIMEAWQRVDVEVTNSTEFDTDDFTVVLQPFVRGYRLKTHPNGLTDYSYLSEDCFHFSQKQGARAALSIWNNMLEPVGKKSLAPWDLYDFKCPTEKHPYLYTRRNSD